MACDLCGCAGGLSLTAYHLPGAYHRIGVQYRYVGFESSHPALFDQSQLESSREYFQTAEVFGRWAWNDRLFTTLRVPYAMNRRTAADEGQQERSGLGDLTLQTDFIFLGHQAGTNHFLMGSLGLKFPTGSYARSGNLDQAPMQLSAGTGSWDLSGQVYYRFLPKTWGLQADGSGFLNGTNPYGYRVGHQVSGGVSGLYRLLRPARNFGAVSQVGFYLDHQFAHGYPDSDPNSGLATGGTYTWVRLAQDFHFTDWGFRFGADIPVTQNIAFGQIRPSPRVHILVYTQFKKSKKEKQ